MNIQPLADVIVTLRNRAGQARAFIAGTRVRVLDIYAHSELQRSTPDEIVEALPHLNLFQVHAALAYYFAHRDEIVGQFREEEELGERFRASIGPGPAAAKRSGS